jgi:NADH-quinone oxidoreductase subunit C
VSEAVLKRVAERFPDAIVQGYSYLGDETLVVRREHLLEVARFCHDDPSVDLKLPLSVTCVDYLGQPRPRFELVYTLYSIAQKHRLRLKVQLEEADPVAPSVTAVWQGLDYWERYCWDMYGIRFTGRTGELRRLWMYEEFVGHPLRKDYPLRGRQPRIPERDFKDIYRGPGPGPGSGPADHAPTPRPTALPVVK